MDLLDKKQLYYKRLQISKQDYILVKDISDPQTWTLVKGQQIEQPFSQQYQIVQQSYNIDKLFFDIDHDELGIRKYYSFQNIIDYLINKQPLRIYNENEVDKLQNIIVQAQYQYANSDFCFNSFTVIDDYSFGKNFMILSNANILMDESLNELEVFKNVQLIVNCQTKQCVKYGVRSQKAIFYAVHEFAFSQIDTNQILDEINIQIWKASRNGTVIIHCLAGMHRAPCILVSQILYRHYIQKQTWLDVDFERIYNKLSTIRTGVAPLSYIQMLDRYKQYLVKKV